MIKRIWDITLTVADLTRAVDFYGNILGLQKKCQFHNYAGFDCGGVEIGIKTWAGRERFREGEACLGLLVDDLDAIMDRLRSKGVQTIRPPDDVPWGARTAIIADPDGNRLQLVQIYWGKYFAARAGR